MKILRLRLANYRGVHECDIRFSPTGLNVVEGLNEAGKTCLAESIHLLFESLDSSKNQQVLSIRPVDRDEGPEVDLEAETGLYSFIYHKRFLKKPETTLRITNPKPENYVGREAHERAESILRETIDVSLWKALWVGQGQGITQANLTDQTHLSTALDRAAGGSSTDASAEDLFERVKQEYDRYFSQRGPEKKESERKDLLDAREAEASALSEVTLAEDQIEALEDDSDRATRLQHELSRSDALQLNLAQALDAKRREFAELQELAQKVEGARDGLSAATAERDNLQQKQRKRQALAREFDLLKSKSDVQIPLLSQREAASQGAEGQVREVGNAEQMAKEASDRAQILLQVCQRDFDYFNDKLHLELLSERKGRIDKAREKAAEAGRVLRENAVDEECLAKIKLADRDLIKAKAQMEASAPIVAVRALADLAIVVDGESLSLGHEETRRLTVHKHLQLRVPDTLILDVSPGSGGVEHSGEVIVAERSMSNACLEAGVQSLQEAEKAFERRKQAEADLRESTNVEQKDLRDLTYEDLDAKLLALRASVPQYLSRRPVDPPVSANLSSAEVARSQAESVSGAAKVKWEEIAGSLKDARGFCDKLKDELQNERTAHAVLQSQLSRIEEDLTRERGEVSDEEQNARCLEAEGSIRVKDSQLQSLHQALGGRTPLRLKELIDVDEKSMKGLLAKHQTLQNELTELRAGLRFRGEDGLQEKLNTGKTRLEHVRRENSSLFRRAASAQALFRVMSEERDRARRSYVAPLRKKIESLGRFVFGESFQVEVDENLAVVNRTLDGITVPFASLSGGTREQLGLIARLATAMIVAADGEAPIVLDDTLGYTDPERLRLMGAVLAKAGKECQVIILTCVPDRYSNIGEATVLRLRPTGQTTSVRSGS